MSYPGSTPQTKPVTSSSKRTKTSILAFVITFHRLKTRKKIYNFRLDYFMRFTLTSRLHIICQQRVYINHSYRKKYIVIYIYDTCIYNIRYITQSQNGCLILNSLNKSITIGHIPYINIKATYMLYNYSIQMKENEQRVFKTNQHPMLENGIVLEVVRTYPTWRMRIQVFFQCRHEPFKVYCS